ncbi:MAG: helix-turn-helix transcriptional regulator [Chloroflexi bacterium]|nr:helix-turn-helix transcriptional regulator [Chloroflexota bacterium]OJV99736.1 MAG: ArsR family transcriptional regulator [Chloroflexi bacterium 54-19]
MAKRTYASDCPYNCMVELTLDVIGGKWKGVLLFHLLGGRKRFNELRRLLPDVTQRMLTLQLRELEEDGLINRTVYAQVPPKVEYSLTKFGETLQPLLLLMKDWGQEYADKVMEFKTAARKPIPNHEHTALEVEKAG